MHHILWDQLSFLTMQLSISSHFETKHNKLYEEVSGLLCEAAKKVLCFEMQ